jgi:NAD(P)-dependent dehydrogenase (short-subunit alcohol dehydrogenase family)
MADQPVALVTGASSGIGRSIAARLLDSGWDVVGASRRRPTLHLPGFTWVPADLMSPSAITELAEHLPPVRAIVHAAGKMYGAPLGRLDPAQGEQMWKLHVEVPTRLVNSLAPTLPDGGRIVIIGSRTSVGMAGKSQYSATKAALIGLARSWAMELAPRAITVNVVAPGPTDTAMLTDPTRSAPPPRVPPLGRLVRPEEVAALTSFLLGPDGGSVTGQQLVICGGASL